MEINTQSSVVRESQHLADRASVNEKPYGRSSLFDGVTFDVVEDYTRMNRQLDRVRMLMLDGKWRTLGAIQSVAGGSDAAISARLRDLRKPKFGGYNVEPKRIAKGLWAYRINGSLPKREKDKSIKLSKLRQIALHEAKTPEEFGLFSRLICAVEKG